MGLLKFIHCGDLHLDSGFISSGFSEIEAKLRRQELKDTFVRIIDKVLELDIDILLISGDFFEHEFISKSTVDFIVKQFKRIGHVKVFISPGNHDPYVGNSYYCLIEWPSNVHIFAKNFDCIKLDELNAVICGSGFTAKTKYKSMLSDSYGLITKIEDKCYKDKCKGNEDKHDINNDKEDNFQNPSSPIQILLMHGTIDGDSTNCPYNPISSKDIAKLGFDYAALGHYHKKIGYLNNRAIYSGSPEPLGFDEPGDHGIIFGTIDDEHRLNTEFIKMNTRSYVAIEIDISDIDIQENIEKVFKNALKDNCDNYVNIILKGKTSLTSSLDPELLLSKFDGACKMLKVTDDTSFGSSIEEIIGFNNIKGIFARIVLEKIEELEDEEEKDKMRRVLKLGLDALDI